MATGFGGGVENTNVPEQQAPEYLRYSRPISGVAPNQSGKMLLTGIGNALEEGVKSADKLMGEHFQQRAMDEGDKIMDDEMAKYEPVYRQLNNIPENAAVNKEDVRGSLMDTLSGKETPPEVQNGIKMAQNYQEVSNKANNTFDATYAKMRVRSALKTLRRDAPGYRKEIDAGMEHSTGMAGANEAYNSILSNINTYITKAQQIKDKEDTQAHSALQAGLMDYETWKAYRDGKITFDTAMTPVGRNATARFNQEQTGRQLANSKATNEDKERVALESLDRNMNASVNNMWDKVALRATPDGVPKTVDGLIGWLGDVAAGKVNADPQQRTAALEALKQSMSDVRNKLRQDSQATYSGATAAGDTVTGAYSALVDPDKVNKRIDGHLSQLNEFYKAFSTGDYSVSQQIAQRMKDIQQNADYHFYTSEVGKEVAYVAAARKVDPKAGDAMYNFMAANNGIDSKFKPLVGNYTDRFIAQPDKKNPATFRSAIDDLRARGAKDPAVYDAILHHVELIPEASTNEGVLNLAKAAFDPSNIGIVSRFSKDSLEYNPVSGSMSVKPGQVDIFKRMLSDDVISRIFATKNVEAIHNVQTFAQNTFGFGIMREALKDFHDVTLERGDRITWNNETHQFGLDTKDDKNVPLLPTKGRKVFENPTKLQAEMIASGSTADPRVRAVLGNLNRAIGSISTIAKYTGEDTTKYIFDTLKANGVDYGDPKVPVPNGLPEAMMRAVTSERAHRDLEQKMKEKQHQESLERSK